MNDEKEMFSLFIKIKKKRKIEEKKHVSSYSVRLNWKMSFISSFSFKWIDWFNDSFLFYSNNNETRRRFSLKIYFNQRWCRNNSRENEKNVKIVKQMFDIKLMRNIRLSMVSVDPFDYIEIPHAVTIILS